MPAYKDTDQRPEKPKNPEKAKGGESLSQVEDIKEDLDSLASNIVGLARGIKDLGIDKAYVAADYVRDRVDDLKISGAEALEKSENRIKARPGQSIAIAFAAGMLASYLLGRRE